MIVGIIGNGFVGKATFQLKCKDIDILAYDINPASCVPQGLVLADMNKCEIVFISVPTPMSKNGSCHLNIIESVLRDLASIDYKGFVVLRSTVPVGTCDKLKCYFMPEFLTEKNFIDDFINNKDWMFGLLGKPEDEQMKEKISTLFSLAHTNDRIKHNNLHFITNKEAEMIKMFKNCYLATKVSFCNEIYQFCENKQVNYEVVRALSTADERILPSHSRVPGHDGQRGFGGTCFPKDTSSLRYEMQQANMTPYILNAIIERNELVDRPQKDWLLDKGRAAVDE
jgi:UDPglucose 6-dehydrogenase